LIQLHHELERVVLESGGRVYRAGAWGGRRAAGTRKGSLSRGRPALGASRTVLSACASARL